MATLSLKLMVEKTTNRVLFAEAGKEFVDFMFGLLALPIGTVIEVLGKERMVGSLGNVYGSLESLSLVYLQANFHRSLLLRPASTSPGPRNSFLLKDKVATASSSTVTKRYYSCSCCRTNFRYMVYLTDKSGTRCPGCNGNTSSKAQFVPSNEEEEEEEAKEGWRGYVEGIVTYMVSDDLVVTPMSTISSITLLNKFGVKDVGLLEERAVEMSMEDGLNLLKASLHSATVLTDVLLKKK